MPARESLATEFTQYAQTKLRDSWAQIDRCLKLLSDEQIWTRPNDVSNSIGNLVIHLNGNVRQWIVAGLGGEPFERDRAAEFRQRTVIPQAEITTSLAETVERAAQIIDSLSSEQLLGHVDIQGYRVTGLAALFHVVEHFSLHTGQIVYATKLLLNRDLSLYDEQGRRLDGRESGIP